MKPVPGERKGNSRQAHGLDFRFFVLVSITLALIACFVVYQNQLVVTSELESMRIDEELATEALLQKSLRIDLAMLSSPDRVARIAEDELGMQEAEDAIFLSYWKDETGSIVPRSSYEKLDTPTPGRRARAPGADRDRGADSAALTSR